MKIHHLAVVATLLLVAFQAPADSVSICVNNKTGFTRFSSICIPHLETQKYFSVSSTPNSNGGAIKGYDADNKYLGVTGDGFTFFTADKGFRSLWFQDLNGGVSLNGEYELRPRSSFNAPSDYVYITSDCSGTPYLNTLIPLDGIIYLIKNDSWFQARYQDTEIINSRIWIITNNQCNSASSVMELRLLNVSKMTQIAPPTTKVKLPFRFEISE